MRFSRILWTLSILSLLVILWSWHPIQERLIRRVFHTYPGLELSTARFVPGEGLVLTDVSYEQPGLRFTSQVALQVTWQGVQVTLTDATVAFQSAEPLDVYGIYQQVWEDLLLSGLPKVKIRVVAGSIRVLTPDFLKPYHASDHLDFLWDGQLETGKHWIAKGTVGSLRFEHAIDMSSGYPMRGHGHFHYPELELASEITWEHVAAQDFRIQGAIQSSTLQWAGYQIDDFAMFFQRSESEWILDYAKFNWGMADVWLSGSGVSVDEFSTFGVIRNIGVDAVIAFFGDRALSHVLNQVRGVGQLAWDMSEGWNTPKIAATLWMSEASIYDNSLHNLALKTTFSDNQVVYELQWDQNSHRQSVNGHFDQEGLFAHITLEQIQLNIPGDFPLEGNFNVAATIWGPINALQGAATIDLTEGMVQGQAWSAPPLSGQAELNWDGTSLHGNVAAKLFNGTLAFAGRRDVLGFWDGDLNIQGIDLGLLSVGGQPFQGLLDFSGQIQRDGQNVRGAMKVRDPQWDEYRFTEASGDIVIDFHTLEILNLDLVGVDSQYQILGLVDLHPLNFDLHIKLMRGRVKEIFPLLGIAFNQPFDGELEGYMSLTGDLAHLEGRLFLELMNGDIQGYPGVGSLDLLILKERIDINRLRLEIGNGMLIAMGSLTPDQLELSVEGTDLPLVVIGEYLQLPQEVAGNIVFKAAINGPWLAFNGHTQLLVSEVVWGSYGFDALNTSIHFRHGVAHFEPLYVVEDQAELLVHGSVGPLETLWTKGWPQLPLDLQVVIPASYKADICGMIEGNLKVQGTLGNPDLTGKLHLTDLNYQLPFLAKMSTGTVEVDFLNTQAYISTLFDFGRKGRISTNGVVTFAQQQLTMNVLIDDLVLIDGPLHGMANGQFFISNDWLQPEITGQVQVDRGRFFVTQLQGGVGELRLNPLLDVGIITPGLRIIGPGIDVMSQTRLRITGAVADPLIRGDVLITDGQINYLGTDFLITQGNVEFPDWAQSPWLRLHGEKHLDNLRIGLLITGEIDSLNVSLVSDPPLQESELLALLNWPKALQTLGGAGLSSLELWEIMSGQASRFMGGVEHAIQQSLDFDLVRIAPSLPRRDIGLSLGKYLWDDLYVTYQRNFFSEERKAALELEYQLHPSVTINTSFDQLGTKRLRIEALKRF